MQHLLVNIMERPEAASAAEPMDIAWPLPVLMVLLLAVLLGFKVFSPSVLRRGPERHLDMGQRELALAVILLLGMMLPGLLGLLTGLGWIPPDLAANQGLLIFAQLALPVAAGFMLAKAARAPAGWRRAGLVPRRPGRDLLIAVPGSAVGLALTLGMLTATAMLAQWIGQPAPTVNHTMLEQLRDSPAVGRIFAVAVSAVIVAPLLEEIVFRGLLQTSLLEVIGWRRRWVAVLLAAAVFALVHAGPVSWHALPGLCMPGVVLGWLYERTGSLLPCVLVHATFNVFNIALVLLTHPA